MQTVYYVNTEVIGRERTSQKAGQRYCYLYRCQELCRLVGELFQPARLFVAALGKTVELCAFGLNYRDLGTGEYRIEHDEYELKKDLKDDRQP